MDFGPNSPIWKVIFWINVVICSILTIVVVRVVRKYESRRKQLEKDIKTPGLHNLRWLFKHRLKEHDIEGEKQNIEPPNADLN
jgi:hypothetical protein